MNVKELLSYAEHNTTFPKIKLKVEGDIIDYRQFQENKGLAGHIYNDGVIRFYIPYAYNFEPKNARIEIEGELCIYKNEIQIKVTAADKAKCIGVSEICKSYDSLKNEYKNYLRPSDAPNTIKMEKEPFNIAVIASEEHDGYKDFKNKVYERYRNRLNNYFVSSMNAKNVAEQLKSAIQQKPDMIVIVRGGKDFLFKLNDKSVLDQIVSAKDKGIYIATGLGHSTTENLLCEDLADNVSDVPSTAGSRVNTCIRNFKEKNTSNNQDIQNSQEQQKVEKIQSSKSTIEEKEKEIQHNDSKPKFNIEYDKLITGIIVVIGIIALLYCKFNN